MPSADMAATTLPALGAARYGDVPASARLDGGRMLRAWVPIMPGRQAQRRGAGLASTDDRPHQTMARTVAALRDSAPGRDHALEWGEAVDGAATPLVTLADVVPPERPRV